MAKRKIKKAKSKSILSGAQKINLKCCGISDDINLCCAEIEEPKGQEKKS